MSERGERPLEDKLLDRAAAVLLRNEPPSYCPSVKIWCQNRHLFQADTLANAKCPQCGWVPPGEHHPPSFPLPEPDVEYDLVEPPSEPPPPPASESEEEVERPEPESEEFRREREEWEERRARSTRTYYSPYRGQVVTEIPAHPPPPEESPMNPPSYP